MKEDPPDIVDRLRWEADKARPAAARVTMVEAAEEIERLRTIEYITRHQIKWLRASIPDLPF